MFLHVTHVEPLEPYRLRLSFDDGAHGEVDLGPELHGEVFEPLRDPELFRQARLHPELGTVFWPNGADFAPEFLHDLLKSARAEHQLA